MKTIVLLLMMAGVLAYGYYLMDRIGRFLEDQRRQAARRELSAREYGDTSYRVKQRWIKERGRRVLDGSRRPHGRGVSRRGPRSGT